MHQTFMAMPAPTLEKTIQTDQLHSFPCKNIKDIKRYLASSPAMAKERLGIPKAEIKGTRNKKSGNVKVVMKAEDMYPTDGSTSSEGVS